MNLTAAQSQEVQTVIERLRTSTGNWISDTRAVEVIGQLIADRDALTRPLSREYAEAFETLDREVSTCPHEGIGRRYHITLPLETAITLRSLIDNLKP